MYVDWCKLLTTLGSSSWDGLRYSRTLHADAVLTSRKWSNQQSDRPPGKVKEGGGAKRRGGNRTHVNYIIPLKGISTCLGTSI